MSDIVHIPNSFECPHIQFHPDRNSFDPKRGMRSLWANLQDLGRQFCLHDCASCEDRISEQEKSTILFWNGDLTEYRNAFARAHEAAGQLPENIYNHLLTLTNNDCPVCAVHSALKQFPKIAEYTESPMISNSSAPCFWGRKTEESGWNYDDNFMHIEALECLSPERLPPGLLPAEDYEVRAMIGPGRAVLNFIQDFLADNVHLTSILTDSELWTILKCRPITNDPAVETTSIWKEWAKKSLLEGARWSSNDICRIIYVANNCYENMAIINEHPQEYKENRGLELSRLMEIFNSIACLCNSEMYDLRTFIDMLNCWRSTFLSFDTITRGNIYISLTIPGKLTAEKICGKAPPFFQCDVPYKHSSVTNVTCSKSNATAQAAAKSKATGGNATIVTEKDAYHQETTIAPMIKAEPKIESGAVKVEANPTINVEAFDLAAMRAQDVELERIRQENETKRIGMILGKMTPPLHVSEEPKAEDDTRRNQQMTDTALWVEWQRKRGEGVTKAEFSLEKGITVTELQAALNRYRDARDGVVWPEPDNTSDNNQNTPSIAERNKDDADKDDDNYNGPEPAANSPKQQFVSATMMTKKEMQDISKRSRKWVDGAVEDSNITPCFIPKNGNMPEGFWRHEAMSAIEAKENKRP